MADSQLILELLFLQRRGGCSLTVLLFFLVLVGTCCFILSVSLCVVRLHIGTRIIGSGVVSGHSKYSLKNFQEKMKLCFIIKWSMKWLI